MTNEQLAQALLEAVRAQRFEETPDALQGGSPVGVHPSIDLAVVAFPRHGAPVHANVLFSRDFPAGVVGEVDITDGPVRNIRFVADLQDQFGVSIAWQPGSDWRRLPWRPLMGQGACRFVAPYPASLFKLLVLVACGRIVDAGRSQWETRISANCGTRSLAEWALEMTKDSSDEATTVLIAHLHACGMLGTEDRGPHALHRLFTAQGLAGLRVAGTRADGGWNNAAGAGVGQLQMTAWDTARLLWLIDPDAPPAPWMPEGSPSLLGESREHVLHCLREQRLHDTLSSGALAGLRGFVRGIPAHLPGAADDSAGRGEVRFLHKTGNTENCSANAGIVQSKKAGGRHYVVALISNLGSRYAPDPACATTWKLPALGAAIDRIMKDFLEI
ncbi:MAG: hypothetical protein JO006_10695 [Paucibacter sp.]|nr:hypothetical protein [Roseateles sp.]